MFILETSGGYFFRLCYTGSRARLLEPASIDFKIKLSLDEWMLYQASQVVLWWHLEIDNCGHFRAYGEYWCLCEGLPASLIKLGSIQNFIGHGRHLEPAWCTGASVKFHDHHHAACPMVSVKFDKHVSSLKTKRTINDTFRMCSHEPGMHTGASTIDQAPNPSTVRMIHSKS